MKRFSMMLLIVSLALSVGLGMTGTAVAESKRGGTLIVIFNNTPRHLNPAVQSGSNTMIPGAQIFAAPLRYDDKWQPQPYLAKSWKFSEDGLSLTLKLVEHATFHDGKPITSEDVAFSIKTVKENHPFKTMFEPVERVDTPDPHTAVIRLSRPHPALLLALSSALCPIIPKHVYGDGQNLKTHPMNRKPIGSGPFKFVEYKPGEHIILDRYENFFIKGRPYLDKIVIKVIKDKNNRLITLEKGDAHLKGFITLVNDVERLQKSSHLCVTSKGYEAIGAMCWLAFNLKRKPFDDKRVRQAIAYAIDRDFFCKRMHRGLSKPATGPIALGSPFYSDDVEKYDLDLEKANKLLNEAGYPKKSGGIRFSITADYIPGNIQLKEICEYLKPQLKKIGIDVKIRPSPDFPTWAKRISNWDFDVTADGVFNWGDPVIGVNRTYLCNNIRKGVIWSNTQNYCNPQVDDILTQASMEVDTVKRKALYAKFQKMVADDLPVYWLFMTPFQTVYDKNLRNLPTSIWGLVSPWDELYFEKQSK